LDKKEFKITADGSHTLYVPNLDETYHSSHGAIQEAMHVFINAGLNFINKSDLKVLEIGFGTGLNAFLTLLEASKRSRNIKYTSLEAYPLDQEIISQLNYTEELNSTPKEIELFNELHQVEWESYQQITEQFRLSKKQVKLSEFKPTEQFDVIYFDAFGPRVQPNMWTVPIFEAMYKCLAKDGVLVTYCAKGSVKRALKEVGFEIEALPGPPGKREMTRAIKV